MRGLVFAGASGLRLGPLARAVSPALLPVYDKPMVYYALSLHLLAGIKDILIIALPDEAPQLHRLLGDGGDWGVNLSYSLLPQPTEPAKSFIVAAEFIGNHSSSLARCDHILYGPDLTARMQSAAALTRGAIVFVYPDAAGKAEPAENQHAEYDLTGLGYYDATASARARELAATSDGVTLTALNASYRKDARLTVEVMHRATQGFDIAACAPLLAAARFIQTVEQEQAVKVGCPEEICWRLGHIDDEQLARLADHCGTNDYGRYLRQLLTRPGALEE